MIYLDHAATSFPKPPGVWSAMQHWFERLGVSAGRGDGQRCAEVAARVDAVRHRLGRMCGLPAHRVVFTSGATEALNLFLDGYLRPGDRFLSSNLEHSSVIRPLVHLSERRQLRGTFLASDATGRLDPERVRAELRRTAHRLLVFTHASNVLGAVSDARTICAIAREHGCTTLLDASQTAGLLDLDVGADAVAASAHKSLLGPPGLGLLAVREGVALPPTRFGGTGSSVALATQPTEWPTAMEPGTPNTPAILGLAAALDYLDAEGPATVLARELDLIDTLRRALADRARLYGPGDGPRVPVLSFNLDGFDPAEVGLLLDAAGIHVRTGYHCAPYLFDALPGRPPGTVRISVGPFSAPADIQAVTTALPRA